MKVTREELEFRIIRQLNNFYNYVYTPGELSRKRTAFYFLQEDLRTFQIENGNIKDIKDFLLFELTKNNEFGDEQEDFINDLIALINELIEKYK